MRPMTTVRTALTGPAKPAFEVAEDSQRHDRAILTERCSRANAFLPPQRLHDLEENKQNGAGANCHGEIVRMQRPEAEERLSERPQERQA